MKRALTVAVAVTMPFSVLSASAAAPDVQLDGGAEVGAVAVRPHIVDAVTFGTSVQGASLVAYRLGTPGGRVVLIVGNVHGDEPKGVDITRQLRTIDIPAGVDLYVVDTINPDGLAASMRQNANRVDLNRNFSFDWKHIPLSFVNPNYSGAAPADQPETQALQNLIASLQPAITVFYHQASNRVSVSGARPEIPVAYARLVGQINAATPCEQGCTGTATAFTNHLLPDGTAFLVELPASAAVTPDVVTRHVNALLTVMVM